MKDSELAKQSIDFSVSLIQYYKWLTTDMKEYVMSKQILKSGTSIGANIHESRYSISRGDFINKIHISLKEASETEYWLIVLKRTGYLPKEHETLNLMCQSLKRMLISTLNTAKKAKEE